MCPERTAIAWLGRQDSNLGMAESKSAALPLGYAPTRGRTILARPPLIKCRRWGRLAREGHARATEDLRMRSARATARGRTLATFRGFPVDHGDGSGMTLLCFRACAKLEKCNHAERRPARPSRASRACWAFRRGEHIAWQTDRRQDSIWQNQARKLNDFNRRRHPSTVTRWSAAGALNAWRLSRSG
jgi:hypothetical protein